MRWRIYVWLHIGIVACLVTFVRLDRAPDRLCREMSYAMIYCVTGFVAAASLPFVLISPIISIRMIARNNGDKRMLVAGVLDSLLCVISYVCMHLGYQ